MSWLTQDLAPPLSQPVPESWDSVEGDLNSLTVCNASFVSTEHCMSPGQRLDNGVLQMQVLNNQKCCNVTSWALGLGSKGAQTNHSAVLQDDVVALRLTPPSTGSVSVYSVDGEAIPAQPVQLQVHPGMLRLFGSHSGM